MLIIDPMELKQKIEEYLKREKISLNRLCILAGVSPVTMWQYMNGNRVNGPTWAICKKILDVIDKN